MLVACCSLILRTVSVFMKLQAGKLAASLRLGGLIILLSTAIVAQVPSPQTVLGFHPTDDKTIADWTQITNYFSRLDIASNRVAVKEIGKEWDSST